MDYETQLLKNKKKKDKQIFVILSNETKSSQPFISDLTSRIIKIMSQHIGSENQISNIDIFEYAYKTHFHSFNIYQKFYYWNIIKKIIHNLRMSGNLFIIIKKSHSYVLKSEAELEKFRTRIKNNIVSLKNLEKIAENWVHNKKFLSISKNF